MKFSPKVFLIIALISISLIPLLWYRPGYLVAKGDSYPYLFSDRSLSDDFYMWSANNIGNPSSFPAHSIYGLLWVLPKVLFIPIGLWQLLLISVYLLVAAISMFYFTKTIYPKQKIGRIVASAFYIFNFPILTLLLNIGMIWMYAFLPLLIALFIKSVTEVRNATKFIFGFALIFAITASVSSINVADVGLILICLVSVLLYYVVSLKIPLKYLVKNLSILLILTILLSIWWIIPILNYFIISPSTQLQADVNVLQWSWTHSRASLLNLFSLNGNWGWRPEYFPYYNSYNNPILTFLLFLPFLLASSALLFRDKKRKLTAYLLLITLVFIFLAKGLHEPLGMVNLLLYNVVPFMNMFREPVSKFTLALIPFLSVLAGYSTEKIANALKRNWLSKLFVVFVVIMFMTAAFPMLTGPLESKTEQLPYSTYVQVPQYWDEAGKWVSNRSDGFRILVTPLDDYYQVPYSWGYYGSESFMDRFFDASLINPSYTYSYKTNQNTTALMNQLRDAFKFNRTEEFESMMDLLNIKYILQRNDIDYEYMALNNRDILNPQEMKNFLSSQSTVKFVKSFGGLDIYEYKEAKPYTYIVTQIRLQQAAIEIQNITKLESAWNFSSLSDVEEWKNATRPEGWQINYAITGDNSILKAVLGNSTWGWKTINSPILPAHYGDIYEIQADIKGQNAHQVHVKIAEYDQNKNIMTAIYAAAVNDGTFNWTHIAFDFEPTNETTKYIQIQVWHGHETDKPFPNIIWIDNVQIRGYTTALNTTGLNLIFSNTTQNQPATILNYQRINPTKITATVDATQPFILAVSETLDSSWTAYVNGESYKPTPLYLGLKGFQINQTGTLDITIEYEPQTWFFYGSVISATTLTVCTVYLTYGFAKNKSVPSKIKQKISRLKSH